MRMKFHNRTITPLIIVSLILICFGLGTILGVIIIFEHTYQNKIYPAVVVNNVSFGGRTKEDVKTYFEKSSTPLRQTEFVFDLNGPVATISGVDLDVSYDASLSAAQAYLVGRSPYFLSNINEKYIKKIIPLAPAFRWNTDVLDALINKIVNQLNIPVQNALFQFENGKVTAFKPSKAGQAVNEQLLRQRFRDILPIIAEDQTLRNTIQIPLDIIEPDVATNKANSFGIKERIGVGYSEFPGSIAGRVHNVALAAGKLNGILIKPGEVFSFNNTVGDISAATGYQSAYIIKDGRTILGDGGGVCQVSTTLFRAALNAGLPILERHEHSYRVHYYEDDGSKAGLDATVFDPTNDLKIKNDTPASILIQTKTDTNKLTLTFELYGSSDGRKAEILDHKVWGETPPPPPLYQDDPTLPKGVVKQVDFAAWGAKASFRYKVTRGNEELINRVFTSNFRPWQAVFLRGTKE